MNELINKQREQIAQLTAERDALAAQVEALRDAGNEVYAELQQWALIESDKETDRVFVLWRKARAATPQQHLAEIRAQAGLDGWLACDQWFFLAGYSPTNECAIAGRQYADSIRQEVK